MKNPYSLTFGSKTYDGSAARTIVASDLGALTSHQTIYALTIKNSAGTTQLTYTPNSATGSLTLTKAMVGLGNVENTALSTWVGTSKITTLGTITTGTWNGTKIANTYLANSAITISGTSVSLGGSITQSALRTALGLGSNAYSSTEYLPLTGGTLTNSLTIKRGSDACLTLENTGGNASGQTSIRLKYNGSYIASIGGYTDGFLYRYNEAYSKGYKIWDEGNFTPSNYLPLTGGTIKNGTSAAPLVMDTDSSENGLRIMVKGVSKSWIGYTEGMGTYFYEYKKYCSFGLNDSGVPFYKDSNGTHTIIHSNNYSSYALPLSGGTIYSDKEEALTIKRNAEEGGAGIKFVAEGLNGWVGYIPDTYGMYLYTNSHYFYLLQDGTLKLDNNIVLHSGNIGSYNAGSATKLKTARTIWGQSFDGTGNVSGNMTGLALMKNLDDIEVLNTGFYGNSVCLGYGTSEQGSNTLVDGNVVVLRYGTSHSTGMFLNSSGNITIGSSDLASTSYKLYVNGYTYINSDVICKGDLTSKTNDHEWRIGTGAGNGTTSLNFFDGSVRMAITDTGNIGLGLASPSVKCHINGTTRIQRVNDASTYLDILCQDISVRYMGYDSDGWVDHIFYSNDSELMRISGSTKRLTVQGNILATGGVTMQSARKLKNISRRQALRTETFPSFQRTCSGRSEKLNLAF